MDNFFLNPLVSICLQNILGPFAIITHLFVFGFILCFLFAWPYYTVFLPSYSFDFFPHSSPFLIPFSPFTILNFCIFQHYLKQIGTFFSFCLFRATPEAYGGSQARGLIRAVAASLHHSHSNAVFDLHYRSGKCQTLNPLGKARD